LPAEQHKPWIAKHEELFPRQPAASRQGVSRKADTAQSMGSDAEITGPLLPNPVRVRFGAIPGEVAWHQPRQAEQMALGKVLEHKGQLTLAALLGIRGVGKTQLAAAQARDCIEQEYELVAWIDAESELIKQLASLGERLGLRRSAEQPPEQLAHDTIAQLGDRGGRALLVFDNVSDPDSIKDFLPVTGTVKVLITTTRRETIAMANIRPVEVGMFAPGQGRALLSAATGLPDDDDAGAVGEALGWLPLGVAQAGAYIKLNKPLGYRQYLERLNRKHSGPRVGLTRG